MSVDILGKWKQATMFDPVQLKSDKTGTVNREARDFKANQYKGV